MKKLPKKHKPTKAEYFKSESQRKRSNRIAFLYGHKPLIAIISVLIVASSVIGLVIVQKSRNSSAATPTQRVGVSFNKADTPVAIANWTGTNTSNNASLTTFAKSSDELTLGFKAGGPGRFEYGTGYQVCWNLALGSSGTYPGLVYHNVRFTYRTNEAGTNGMGVYLNGQQVGLSEDKKLNGNPNTPHEGGALFDKTIVAELGNASPGSTVSFCNVKIGGSTPYFTTDRYITVYAYTFGASYDKPINQYEILGSVKDNSGSHKAIAGVTVSNCQTTTTTDSSGLFRFYVSEDSYYCIRVQGGLDPNTYVGVKAINDAKGAINVGRSADGSSYENQHATGRSTNYDFWATLNPAFATPTTSTPCTGSGNGNPVQVEAENAVCGSGASSTADDSASGGKAAALSKSEANVQYTFTAPTKGLYQAVARIRNTSSTSGKVNIDYKKLNTGASDIFSQGGKAITGTGYVNYTVKNSAGTVQTHCLEANQKAVISVLSQSSAQVYVDTISLVRSADCPESTANTGNTGGNTGSANAQTTYNSNCTTASTSTGLPSPVAAVEGVKSGTAINKTVSGKQVVYLQKDGDYVECMITLPAGAEAGGYVLGYTGSATVAPGQSVYGTGSQGGDYNGTSIKLSMAGDGKVTAPYTKSANIAAAGTFPFDRAPIIRSTSSNKPTVRYIKPGEKVVVRATLARPSANNGQMYIETLQLYKDPCMDSNGNVIQDGRDVGGGIKCEPPKTDQAPTVPATPAPAANNGEAADAAAAIARAAKCSADATDERTVEAEKSVCVPNTSNPATVVTASGVKSVALRNDGQYVEFSFKNNKTAGKYRAASIVKAAGTEAYVIYDLVKERPGAIDTTTAEARNISQSFGGSSMSQQAKYQDLTNEEIAQGVTLKVRVTYKRKTTTTGSEKTIIYVDKLSVERVGDSTTPVISVTPTTPTPTLPRLATGTGGSGDDQTKAPTNSSSGSTTKAIPTNTTGDRVVNNTGNLVVGVNNTIVTSASRAYIEKRRACINAFYRNNPTKVLKHMYISPDGGCQPEVATGVVQVIEAG